MKRAVKGLDHVVVMVDGIDAAEAAYRQARLPGPAARLPQEARHGQPPDDLRHRLFRDPGHRRGHRVQRRAPRLAEGRRRARQRGAGDRRRRPRLRRLQGRPACNPMRRCSSTAPSRSRARPSTRKFRTVRIPKTNMPVVGFFVCEHLTPEFVYRGEWAKHPNGARGILGVTVIAEQPAKWTAELEKYFGAGSVKREGDGLVVDTGTQPIRYLHTQGLRGALSRRRRRCGRAIIRRCSACASTASPPARRCWRGTASRS